MIIKLLKKWSIRILGLLLITLFVYISLSILKPYIGIIPYKTNCEKFVIKTNDHNENFRKWLMQIERINNGLWYVYDYKSCNWKIGIIIFYENKKMKKNIIKFIWNNETYLWFPYVIQSIYLDDYNINKFSKYWAVYSFLKNRISTFYININ